MPTLEWMGKNKVVAYHRQVPYRVLDRVPEKASWIHVDPIAVYCFWYLLISVFPYSGIAYLSTFFGKRRLRH